LDDTPGGALPPRGWHEHGIYDRTRVSMRRVALLPGRSEMGIKQYRALLDAMVRGDADEAERCVRELNASAREYIERYKNYVI
jgi:DNA-binding FadR family transcriptional regulator